MTVGARRDLSVPTAAIHHIVELACRAPSVHNTQPWSWRAFGHTLELHADPSRQLSASDPQGRNLTISCGGALHHAQVAARVLGWQPSVTRPPFDGSTLLARLELSPAAPPPDAAAHLRAIRDRCTDRRRFTAWPVPAERLQRLATTAREWGAKAWTVLDPADRVMSEVLVGRALDRQASDRGLTEEQLRWIDRSDFDGVPGAVIPRSSPTDPNLRSRYGTGLLVEPDRALQGSDGLLVLCGDSDDTGAWLRTGEALSALWFQATNEGLAVVPLSQAIELAETRETLRTDLLGGIGFPHILIRVGWLAIGRGTLPTTPRRPIDDVLTLCSSPGASVARRWIS